MAATVDARGLSCPQPVILTLNEINSGRDPQINILVDTETSKENVSRAAVSKGCSIIEVVPESGGYRILIQKAE